ncbi:MULTISPECIES: D-2-hydroxyacid dehydrogenase [Bacillus]|uniref:D-2-hydroxyacid dehydrogenase n=1 Tax=Bacillus TaxID=1386 RepID=UPI000BB6E070|nr:MULTISPECIES: D-2-hydroxyacid dehydrogenase [Bacillus]
MLVVSTFLIREEKLLEDLKNDFPNVTFEFYKSIKEVPATSMSTAEVILTYGTDLTSEDISTASKLKWIMVASAGVEKLPFAEIKERNILVTNAKGIHGVPMAEYTLAMILQVTRSVKTLIKYEMEEEWNRKVPTTELSGKTITIIGAGAIGTEIAKLAQAFNINTIGVNRSGKPVDYFDEIYKMSHLEEALQKGDFIVSVLPSTNETKYIIDKHHFNIMKESAIFINIGRGDLVKEDILIQSLTKNEIFHAVLDVFETEPLPKGHPLWKMDNVTVTPHISSITQNYQPRALNIFANNLKCYLKQDDNYINRIDVERGY